MTKILAALVMIIVLLSFAACDNKESSIPETQKPLETPDFKDGIRIGNLAPDFSLYDLEGKEVKLSDFRGKVVMLVFWETWCHACESEMPSLEALYKKYKDRGFVILAVNIGNSQDEIKKFIKIENLNLTFPILLDSNKAIYRGFGVYSLPTAFIIKRDGVISDIVVGRKKWEQEPWSKLIADLL